MQNTLWLTNPFSNVTVARRITKIDTRISVPSILLAFMLFTISEETSGSFILLVNLQASDSQDSNVTSI